MIETMHTFTQFGGNVWLAHDQLSIQERPALDLQIVSVCAKPSSVRILTSNTNHYIHYETAMEYCYGILLWLHIQYKHVQVLQKRRHEIQDKSAPKFTGLKLPNWFYLWHPQMMLTENHHVESVNQRTEWLCGITRSYSSQLQNFIALNVANNMAGCQVGQNQGLVHPISNIPGSSSTIGFSYNIIGYHGTTSFRLGNLRYTMDIYGHLWTSMGPFRAWFLDISGDPKSPKQSSSLWVKFSVSSRFSPSCATTSRPGMWPETRPKNPNLWGDLQDFQHGKLQERYSKKMTSPSSTTIQHLQGQNDRDSDTCFQRAEYLVMTRNYFWINDHMTL